MLNVPTELVELGVDGLINTGALLSANPETDLGKIR